MISPEALRKLAALNLTQEQLIGVADVIESVTNSVHVAQKKPNAIRQQRHREKLKALRNNDRSNDSDVTTVTTPSPPPSPSPDKEISQTLLENNLSPLPPPQPFSLSAGDEFERFWEIYPNKVGKADARKKFPAALRKIGIEPMLEALSRYASKADDRPWLNPATWLFQERWTDQPAAAMPRASPGRPVSALEAQTQKLREKIANEYGFGREESRYSQDVAPLRLTSSKAD